MAENTEQQGMEEELHKAQEASAEVDREENAEAASEETSGEEAVESSQSAEEGNSEENPELLQLKDKYLRTLESDPRRKRHRCLNWEPKALSKPCFRWWTTLKEL